MDPDFANTKTLKEELSLTVGQASKLVRAIAALRLAQTRAAEASLEQTKGSAKAKSPTPTDHIRPHAEPLSPPAAFPSTLLHIHTHQESPSMNRAPHHATRDPDSASRSSSASHSTPKPIVFDATSDLLAEWKGSDLYDPDRVSWRKRTRTRRNAVIGQARMKRLFGQRNLHYADDDDEEGQRLRDSHTFAIWELPQVKSYEGFQNPKIRRQKDLVLESGSLRVRQDNSGSILRPPKYFNPPSFQNRNIAYAQYSKQPVLRHTGFHTQVLASYAENGDLDLSDGELEGRKFKASDDECWEIDDSEWEAEDLENVRMTERREKLAKRREAKKKKKELERADGGDGGDGSGGENETDSEEQGPSAGADLESLVTYDEESKCKRRQLNNGSYVTIVNDPPNILPPTRVEEIIHFQIDRIKYLWEQKHKPKLDRDAYDIYIKEKPNLPFLILRLEDLIGRTLPGLVERIKEGGYRSEREVVCQCRSLEGTVENCCEVEWYIDLLDGEVPERPVSVEKEKMERRDAVGKGTGPDMPEDEDVVMVDAESGGEEQGASGRVRDEMADFIVPDEPEEVAKDEQDDDSVIMVDDDEEEEPVPKKQRKTEKRLPLTNRSTLHKYEDLNADEALKLLAQKARSIVSSPSIPPSPAANHRSLSAQPIEVKDADEGGGVADMDEDVAKGWRATPVKIATVGRDVEMVMEEEEEEEEESS
ncbi:hypothetical protein HK097_001742, partial [Rhizophlyctis rosea]